MIIVTHEMAFARDVSTRTIFMDKGYVAEDASPDVPVHRSEESEDKRISEQILGRMTIVCT